MAKRKKNILGSTLYREPKLDCGISLNVSSQRLNMAPRWSLGRQMIVCTELKMVTAALPFQEGMAVSSVVPLTLYERSQKHLGLDHEMHANVIAHTNYRGSWWTIRGHKEDCVRQTSKITRNLFSVFGHDHRFLPCLLELLCSLSKQSRQQLHLLSSAIIFTFKIRYRYTCNFCIISLFLTA